MGFQVTKAQLAGAVSRINGMSVEDVRPQQDGTLMARCCIQNAMRLTFELAAFLGVNPGDAASYRELIPMHTQQGSDTVFSWRVELIEPRVRTNVIHVDFGTVGKTVAQQQLEEMLSI